MTPDKLFGKTEAEIKAVNVWWGNKEKNTGDLFYVSVDETAGSADEVKIVLDGDLSRVKRIGNGMTAGEIEANSTVDMHCGAMMRGGKIVIEGDAVMSGADMTSG